MKSLAQQPLRLMKSARPKKVTITEDDDEEKDSDSSSVAEGDKRTPASILKMRQNRSSHRDNDCDGAGTSDVPQTPQQTPRSSASIFQMFTPKVDLSYLTFPSLTTKKTGGAKKSGEDDTEADSSALTENNDEAKLEEEDTSFTRPVVRRHLSSSSGDFPSTPRLRRNKSIESAADTLGAYRSKRRSRSDLFEAGNNMRRRPGSEGNLQLRRAATATEMRGTANAEFKRQSSSAHEGKEVIRGGRVSRADRMAATTNANKNEDERESLSATRSSRRRSSNTNLLDALGPLAPASSEQNDTTDIGASSRLTSSRRSRSSSSVSGEVGSVARGSFAGRNDVTEKKKRNSGRISSRVQSTTSLKSSTSAGSVENSVGGTKVGTVRRKDSKNRSKTPRSSKRKPSMVSAELLQELVTDQSDDPILIPPKPHIIINDGVETIESASVLPTLEIVFTTEDAAITENETDASTLGDPSLIPLIRAYGLVFWTCNCGSQNENMFNFCGMCRTPQKWACTDCSFQHNKCKFKYCGNCSQPKDVLLQPAKEKTLNLIAAAKQK